MTSYYAHPFASNSDLTKLQQELGGKDAIDTTQAFLFGTLVHAMILEPHTVDLIRRRVVGVDHEYTAEDLHTARKMRASFLNDSFCRNLLDACDKEVEMYNPGTQFCHQGISFTLDTRRKYDLWSHLTWWGGDLKSTTATSQAQFEQAIGMFDYDRARVFYAAGSGAIQDVIIGVSKVAPYRVFKVFMKRGDRLWSSGEAKMNEIAFKYWSIKAPQTV
jgi:hypothetical protein